MAKRLDTSRYHLYGGRPQPSALSPRDFVLDGAPASPPLKGHGLSQFSANVCCGQTAGWIKVAYGGRPRPRRLCVRCGPSSPREKGTCTHPYPIFGHVYSGQTTGWIKMPLGMEVNIGPGDVVLDGVAATPKRGTAPRFQFMSCGQTAGWMKTPLGMVWKRSTSRPRPHCIRRVPSAPPKGHSTPSFRPMSIVVTVAHLSYC